ncbi:unnamed protein product [Adineta steineri]|uniref:Uncharacterized protein n=1 Tax=Adineta steineri TaxID=433720 RepID=A0A814SRN3_9BILA|nr:unnamed protein product [Adineta steineri]CAF3859710.1 unnamed protein product [Adineta steineri]
MGSKLSGLGSAVYDSKRKQFLGRDGAGWGKLGVFYFFFYIGLAGFFCAMLAIFMAFTPRDHPRYTTDESRMETRSNPLAPGLGFRPQPDVDKNLIFLDKTSDNEGKSPYAESLDQYLQIYYWKQGERKATNEDGDEEGDTSTVQEFNIANPGGCVSGNDYGYKNGRPCVLVKMNKIVGFEPIPGYAPGEKGNSTCGPKPSEIAVHCQGEYPADVDNMGPITYMSEKGQDRKCGSLDTKWFPYHGKSDRKNVYQAPYIWVQFEQPKPNVLINVICRVYGQNIHYDKKTGRALTRFQIYVKDLPQKKQRGTNSRNNAGEN